MMQTTLAAQLVFAVFLVILTCLGHLALVPAIKWSSKELCPFLINNVIFDALVIITGPMIFFLSNYLGPWFDENSRACQAVEFFEGYSICGSLISLGILAWMNRKYYVIKLSPLVTGVMIACPWLIPIVLAFYLLLVRGDHDSRIPWLMTCSSSDGDDDPVIEMINVLLALGTCTTIAFMIYLGRRNSKFYHIQFEWKRHRREININSPECSTIGISESTSISMERNISMVSLNKIPAYFPPNYLIQQTKNKQRNDSPNNDINEVFYDRGVKNITIDDEDEKGGRCRRYGESRSTRSPSSPATDRFSHEFEFIQSVTTPCEPQTPEEKQSEDQSLGGSPSNLGLHTSAEYNSCLPTSPRVDGLASPAMISPFSSPSYPAILSFKDLKRLKSAKWIFISPLILDFEREDRDSFTLKSLIFVMTCLSLVGWSWLAMILFFRVTLGEMTEGLWFISTWLIYLRLSISSILYAIYFAEEWLIMWRMEWYYKRYESSVELSSCAMKIGDSKAVQLNKLTIFKT